MPEERGSERVINIVSVTVVVFFLISLLMFGEMIYDNDHRTYSYSEQKIENVVRVMMHQRNEYSLVVKDSNSNELAVKTYRAANGVKIFADVPRDEMMWAKLQEQTTEMRVFFKKRSWVQNWYLEIHVHSQKNIEGAGWERSCGKSCIERGTTQIIE